ncbi:hypothetical protein GCM10010168_45720 [Actinoplanes ianthinogenes]|uniref:Pyridoxamine 5'-phosphate oxidase N-terminal domain-containing protein n=1 Tax=Actinoplanes ianthinogenes TaxID=122358 RepID=A0ABM7LPI8_9ACTN|nr:pyridoxamine 5'-phosphate oxidase family protein [Actinoplanes ianthinogenes]BCJ41130.1 hypothetical protein Aiant_17870 [Actinoplanes ianthinogenes]GGR22711.1 hypothetical protein GCM10010168_45720 [Actinoplanes ianthinogenes]
MEPDAFYHGGSETLQEAFGTRELAAHLARRYVTEALEDDHVRWIRGADAVFVATVSPDGQPECSYKGGLPGFVRVLDDRTLEIPSYDGNGMYRTLGNAAASSRVGLLFLFPELPAKLRVNGISSVTRDAAGLQGAEAVLRIRVEQVFENCPRYLHDPATGAHSAHCPRPGYTPPEPAWKQKPEYDQLLPARTATEEGP